jgi:ribosomal protein S18 acetylase RimI-like enzyme
MAVVVRPISLEDADGFQQVLDSVARERSFLALVEAPPIEEVQEVVRANVEEHAIHFVAVDGLEIVGWCDIHGSKQQGFTHTGRLGMGVRADYRRRGIGRLLTAAALGKAIDTGLTRVELEVFASNTAAVHLYESLGFVKEGFKRNARYLDGAWDDMAMMAWTSAEKPRGGLFTRIEREAGVPGLIDVLSRLPPTDLQSVLLEVQRIAAARRQPSSVLADYRTNRFVRPAKVVSMKLVGWEKLALSHLPAGFEAIELSPTCPLGTSSAIAAINQNWAVSTIRNTEVVSDPTNVLALECAARRGLMRAADPKSANPVHLAARHRVLRPQHFTKSDMVSHFGIFCLVSAGRYSGNRQFEVNALGIHVRFYLTVLREYLGVSRRIVLSLSDFGARDDRSRLEKEFLTPIREEFVNVDCTMNDQRTSGRGYYRDLCCKIHIESDAGELMEVADGGSVDWAQKLLSDSKEALVISGIGSERVCA